MSIKWISIPEYMKETGLSRDNVKKLIEQERLICVITEGGQTRIKMEDNTEFIELKEELKTQRQMLEELSQHLGLGKK
ncbi:hypothetical protein SAMN02745751_01271 [Dethiosulfatibacter aminovorans DSM 17477]|uniref:DNA binding domain-containing protein, excisionase family n=1 Tax=Dethiosulfatibacter aminovorans DSM 17477 TaxID=1121476 RepID=A0A1M6EPP2_9FIRM|nr:hypothetical protein [Dethiosulfatibacter aminovorans]SHI87329.1 hypothetical protein SAMN02745751_01271 [Dethiosulfatibacter aminovorans DSM 17477]